MTNYDERLDGILEDHREWMRGIRTEVDAAIAYNGAAMKYHGRYKKLNEIPA